MDGQQNDSLWRSCYLGMRIAFQTLNLPIAMEKFRECVALLCQIGRNETTLHEPQYNLVGPDEKLKDLFITSGNQTVLADHDLASQIVASLGKEGSGAQNPLGALMLHADPTPLRVDEGGAIRVGGSRISLDLVVEQYENGMTPEDMVRAYDTLVLADIYAVIAYFLRHRESVQAYLKRRDAEAQNLRAKIEAEHPRVSREELLARRSAREKANAPTSQ